MKQFLKTMSFIVLASACQLSQAAAPNLVATYTVNVMAIKDSIAFSGCSKIITVPPDSDVISFYDDGTFTEAVTVNSNTTYLYGMWAAIDTKISRLRFTYTGNPGERTGTWGDYVSNMEAVAGVACNYSTVEAYGATLRFLRGDITVKTPLPGAGTGTATSSFQTEIYGYDVDYGMYGRGTENRTTSGAFVWY